MFEEIEMSASKRSARLKLGEIELGNFDVMMKKEDDLFIESSENEES